MKPIKTYDASYLQNFRNEATKYLEDAKNNDTLDTLLAKSKKEVVELIKAGCTPAKLRQILQNAGIEVSERKLKQLFFAPPKPRKKRQKVQDINTQTVALITDQAN